MTASQLLGGQTMSTTRKPNVISLYTGAGGLDYGFEAAGFETSVALELDHDCCETLRASRPWPVIQRSIFDIPTEEVLETASVRAGDVDIVIGGPPCQPFSKAGFWAHGDSLRLADPRADTLSAYLRVIEEALPRAFLLENVEGLTYNGKDDGLRMLLSGIRTINRRTKSAYRPSVAVLNAAAYGVPQLRERVFLIAARDCTVFNFPPATHAPDDDEGMSLIRDAVPGAYRTAWDAIGDIGPEPDEDLEVRGKWAPLLPSIPEGQNYLWHTSRGGGRPLFGWRRRYWTFLLKLAKAKPSWTIQAQPGPAVGPFHWNNRRLSTRELCRLQTFPEDVVIRGGRTSVQRQVGNAVPSLLAEVLARAMGTQLLGLPLAFATPRLLPPIRLPVPPPEPYTDIPKAFLKLEGYHAPHLGTGQGTRARVRTTQLQ
jgi:DNA (cytosine-5)-methyltransferase 1